MRWGVGSWGSFSLLDVHMNHPGGLAQGLRLCICSKLP